MKIDELTPEQEALVPVVRDEWIARCDDGAEIDKPIASKQIDWLYRFSKLKPPAILFVSSPLGAQYAAALIKAAIKDPIVGANVEANVGDNVWDNVGDNVGANVRDNVGANVEANVGDNVGANVRDNVGANVGA